MDFNQTKFDRDCSQIGEFSQSILTTEFRFSPTITIIIYITYLLPFCFGVFGNISVCLIFFQQKKLRSITNTFLMNLCLNDLIVLCVSIPMTLSNALLKHWIFGSFLCKIVHFTPTVTALVSTFTVAVIAVERWFFIVNKQKFDRRCTIITLILLWLVSIIIALPEFISRQLEEFVPHAVLRQMMGNNTSFNHKMYSNNNTNLFMNYDMIKSPCKMKKIYYCVVKPGIRNRIFSYIVITVQYLVPFLFVSISCYSISRFLKRRMIRMRSYQNQKRFIQDTSKSTKKKSLDIPDETEQEATSLDDIPSAAITNDNKSNYLLHCFRQTFQQREQLNYQQNSLNFVEQQHMLKYQSHTKRRFHRSRKLLIYVAALFTISWLPLTIVQIYSEHNEETLYKRYGPNFVYGYLLIPCYLISSLSAWINPIIYNYINRSFRREFYSLYSCCFKGSSTTSRKESTSIILKRQQTGRAHNGEVNTTLSTRLTLKQNTHGVNFADQTVVMMHKQT
ncbi:unnamed protein product [Adineta steineri]|uniref:G-protein coupled receptors family 1 profile domain-containing protein n=1 Tax=Adineta steineri TaxID=433720 RepID=A0A815BMB4_9BILA|nr:unnamed protein product [Adineta steineri]